MNKEFENKLPEVIRLLKQNNVKRAYAFGSVLTDKFNAESDIDLLISFEDNLDPIVQGSSYWILEEQLEKLLNRQVELVAEHTLNNPYFIKKLNQTKVSLYE
jgi:predicted nucleotidyltransferase